MSPAVGLSFLAVSMLLFRKGWEQPGRYVFGGQDGILFTWFLRWTQYAVAHGTDPFLSHRLNAPAGVNLMWNTGVPLLGFLVAPVTALAGPVFALTVLVTLAPALSGWVLFLVLRRWVPAVPAAVGGLMYGFSPYMIGAGYGHPHLAMAVFPPVGLLLLDDLLIRQAHVRRTGILLGLAAAAQLLVSEEILATSALVAALGMAVLAATHPGSVAARGGPALRGLAVAAGVAAPLVAWPLAVQFAGPQRIHGAVQLPNIAVSDAWTFVTPTSLQALAPARALRVSARFTGNHAEVGGYLGVTLIALLGWVAVRLRRDPLISFCGPLLVVVAALSLGPRLHVAGHDTGIPLPWRLVATVPLLGNVLPSRLALYVMMLAGMMIAVMLGRLRGPGRPLGAVAVAAALLPLVPSGPIRATPVSTPRFFTDPRLAAYSAGGTALVLPYPDPERPAAMLWQAQAGLRFRLAGCYCIAPGADGRPSFHAQADPLNTALLKIESGLPADPGPGVLAAYRRLDPSIVIVGPAPHATELRAFLARLTLAPARRLDGVDVWWPATTGR